MASGGVASALRRLASAFLTRCSASAPEAEVLDYLTGVLEDGEADVDALADIVSGFVPAFGALPEAEREEALVALLDEALCAKLAAQASCADPPPQQQPAVPPRATARPEQQPVRGASSREQHELYANNSTFDLLQLRHQGGTDGGADDPAVDTLVALRPSLPPEFLAHALRSRFRGDAHSTAAWLLDGAAEADAAHAAWARERDAQRREEEEAAAAREALRSGILERYDIQVVSAAGGGGGVVMPAGPMLGARRSGAVDDAPPKQRYHGGQIVAQRGEKYIVEKLTPEWDGGSRGKVRPKGKRGKAA